MGRRGVVVRIVGLVSTTHGFAYAVTEGPRNLVSVGLREISPRMADVIRRLDKVVSRARPLFVAFDRDSSQRKGRRGKQFVRVVSSVCEKYGLMLLPIRHEQMRRWSERTRPTKWDIGNVIAKWFPALAGRLPPRRKPWESENDRIGIFVALAAAVAAWDAFRGQ